MKSWTRSDVLTAYNIPYWGEGYIDVNDSGEILIRPSRTENGSINLPQLTRQIVSEGLSLPVLVRFSDILHDRVNRLCDAFNQAARQQDYQGHYTVVYPIKVNQQRRVVEEIIKASPAMENGQVGLEAGSKPELMAVLALSERPGSTIVCNGYKDREYIRLALIGQKLGHNVYIVIEKLTELNLILEEAQRLDVRPLVGVRARLASIGKGNWQNTGGEKSKFGLSSTQILTVVQRLRDANALDCLRLLHFHLGSQIANIRDIQRGLGECARFYGQLRQLGAPVDVVDVGGGLGVDYEGTRSRSACSANYSLDEYAYHVVHAIKEECARNKLPHPALITESGRALTAHHAVLITDVIDVEQIEEQPLAAPSETAPSVIKNLWGDYQALLDSRNGRSLLEIYHDAAYALSEAQELFAHGVLNLEQRAQAEQLYQAVCLRIRAGLNPDNRAQREVIDELNEKLADKFFVNFSLFQSLPDIWGIDQIFPILPLENLDQPPTRRAVLQDITCDSDGRVDLYVDQQGVETTLPLPPYQADRPYLLGFFMTGAYQEILGDMHNLFGDTNSIDVALNPDGSYRLEHAIEGDTVAKVLRYVNLDPATLKASYQRQLEDAELPASTRTSLLQELEQGFEGYTYLER